jgi:type IV secretory pathway VirB2 component (pilin)
MKPLKTIKEQYRKVVIASSLLLIPSVSNAAEDSPFDKLINIIDVITEALTSQIATAVIGLAVIIGGFMAIRGRIPWAWFYGVLVSALIISGGSWIAQLVMTGKG